MWKFKKICAQEWFKGVNVMNKRRKIRLNVIEHNLFDYANFFDQFTGIDVGNV